MIDSRQVFASASSGQRVSECMQHIIRDFLIAPKHPSSALFEKQIENPTACSF